MNKTYADHTASAVLEDRGVQIIDQVRQRLERRANRIRDYIDVKSGELLLAIKQVPYAHERERGMFRYVQISNKLEKLDEAAIRGDEFAADAITSNIADALCAVSEMTKLKLVLG